MHELNGAELDRWITGNYGDDQYKEDDCESCENPGRRGCGNCDACEDWADSAYERSLFDD